MVFCAHKQTTNFVQSTTQAQPPGCKQTGVLDSADEDVQRAVCVDRGPGGVGHKASIGGDPVDNGVWVAPGLTAQSHALTLQSSQLLRQREERQLVGGLQHMLNTETH